MKYLAPLVTLILIISFIIPVGNVHAAATTFVVNSLGDGADVNPGDGIAADATGAVTLRAAMQEANASPGTLDTIRFNIPGTGPYTIQPASALPIITDPVIIDGTTQPGFNGTPIIQIDGINAGDGVGGFKISAGNSTVRGLVINRFLSVVDESEAYLYIASIFLRLPVGKDVEFFTPSNGITLLTNGGNTIEGNYIGTDVTGRLNRGNTGNGIYIESGANNLIGGATPSARNVISGNHVSGIRIKSGDNNVVRGNYIGINAIGDAPIPNDTGIILGGDLFAIPPSGNIIGGHSPGYSNVISGNTYSGIQVSYSNGNTIEGNFIGTDANGSLPIGNRVMGVYIAQYTFLISVGSSQSAIDFGYDNVVGGVIEGTGNTIAYNGRGVVVSGFSVPPGGYIPASRNAILGNSIHSNTARGELSVGIDLMSIGNFFMSIGNIGDYNIGVTSNDIGDGDIGPNEFQNYPVLTSAIADVSNINISGTLNSKPSQSFRIEFFANSLSDPSGYGEGERYLGYSNVTTDAVGNSTFNSKLPVIDPNRLYITATATDSSNNTSEFSAAIKAEILTISSITPNLAINSGSVNIDKISGTNFKNGTSVKLTKTGSPDIIAGNIVVVSPTQITCQFNFTGTEWGYYDVVVTNPDGQSGTLPQGFRIRTQPATISGIAPAYGVVNTAVNIALTGSGFISGSTIKLTKTGQPDIVAVIITFDPTRITGTFGLVGAAIGSWDVTVVNPDNQTASVAGAFTVTMPTTEITIGQGTQSIEYLMGTNVHDRRVQVIYLANEIGQAGAISALALNVATPPGATLNNWTIRMRHFTQSTQSGIWIVAGAWDTVYQGNEPPGTSGWRVFNFSQPFEYNGSQNLEIDFSFNNSAVGGASGFCFYSIPGGNRTLFGASNSANGDPLNWTSNVPLPTLSDKVPNIRLTMGSTGGYNLTVNVSPAGSGTVNYNGGTFQAGSQLNLVAQANVGWVFDHWGGNANGTNPNINLTMDSNKSVTAYFRAIQNTLTIATTKGGSVTTPGEGIFTYNYFDSVALMAVPDSGYRFVDWTGQTSTITDYTSSSTAIVVGGNYSIIANFTRITYQLTINIQGSGITDPPSGVYICYQGAQVQITATPATGWSFVSWSGDVSVSANPISVTMDGNKTMTAIFKQQYTLNLTTIGSGTTDPVAGTLVYTDGATVVIRAIPATNWVFSHWSGDVSGTAPTVTVFMGDDKSVTANFTPDGTVAIGAIWQDPARYLGKTVTLVGAFRGYEAGHGTPPVSRSDWVLQDATGSLYVTGPTDLRHPRDIGRPISVTGVVRQKGAVLYIEIPRRRR